MPGDDTTRNLDYERELASSIKSLYDLTTRIDERVERVIQEGKTTYTKLEAEIERNREMLTRISVLEKTSDQGADVHILARKIHDLELKVQSIEITSGKAENRWKTMVNFGLQLAWVIIAAYLLYKLGIQAPAVP